MNPNQTKDRDRSVVGQNPKNPSRDKYRDDKAASKPDQQDEMKDPVGTPETNQPLDDPKRKPPGQNLEPGRKPREDQSEPQDPGYETDVLKPGR
jgi:hypothetical protein